MNTCSCFLTAVDYVSQLSIGELEGQDVTTGPEVSERDERTVL